MHRVEDVMGMPILVEVSDDDVDEQVFKDVFGWFRWVDSPRVSSRAGRSTARRRFSTRRACVGTR